MGRGTRDGRPPRPRRADRGRVHGPGPVRERSPRHGRQQRPLPREESYLRFDLTGATVELRHLYGYSNADWTFTARSAHAKWEPPDDLPSSHTAQLAEFLDGYEAGIRPDLGRPTMELVTALYKAAITGLPVRRGEVDATDPFHGSLDGGRPEVFR